MYRAQKDSRVFYIVTLLLVLTGWVWLALNTFLTKGAHIPACLFKNITGVSCPSCGTTTSVLYILHWNLGPAISTNVLGYFALAALLVLPAWLAADFLLKSKSLYETYDKLNSKFRKQPAGLLLILLAITINWIWILYTSK